MRKEYLIVRLVEIENRKNITNDQGQIVSAEIKFKFLDYRRNLLVGGKKQGTTNQKVELRGGNHTISLGAPKDKDFTPQNMRIVLEDTRNTKPMEVRFEKI